MFKIIIRVAIAFAVVWMLVPHGSDIGVVRPGLAAVAHYFGWSHTPADVNSPVNNSAHAAVSSDCESAIAAHRPSHDMQHGARSVPPPPCIPEKRR